MQINVFVKKSKEPIEFRGDRIDIKDYTSDGVKYKQVRTFKKGFSKSVYIEADNIVKIKELP
jgi:hypothetical protein